MCSIALRYPHRFILCAFIHLTISSPFINFSSTVLLFVLLLSYTELAQLSLNFAFQNQ
jgi:hypothetical protein